MFAYRDTRGAVDVAFTDRHGGESSGEFASLNLASRGADDDAVVARNVERAVQAFGRAFGYVDGRGVGEGPRAVGMRQVHGGTVHLVDRAHLAADPAPSVEADGLVTGEPGVVLMVRVADCVPVLLADVEGGPVGAVHAGRPGLVAEVVPHAVTLMREQGARDLVAWVGPHVCGQCYEVPAEMRAQVAAAVPEAYSETSWGTPAVDVGAGVRAQLRTRGVEIVDAARCTIEHEDLFSYRRQGPESGRMAGLVWVRP